MQELKIIVSGVYFQTIKCNVWECANNSGGYCKLGESYTTPLIIEDCECKSYELKGADK